MKEPIRNNYFHFEKFDRQKLKFFKVSEINPVTYEGLILKRKISYS